MVILDTCNSYYLLKNKNKNRASDNGKLKRNKQLQRSPDWVRNNYIMMSCISLFIFYKMSALMCKIKPWKLYIYIKLQKKVLYTKFQHIFIYYYFKYRIYQLYLNSRVYWQKTSGKGVHIFYKYNIFKVWRKHSKVRKRACCQGKRRYKHNTE